VSSANTWIYLVEWSIGVISYKVLMLVLVYVWSTFRVVELKTRFESWLARNEVKVCIHFTYNLYVLNIGHISCTWNESTPFTSFLATQVSNCVLSSTKLIVNQTCTNIIIWRETRFQPVFSKIAFRSTNET
jgi:hypothetical protein